jgi:septal ring-binding cell division protein DamX
MSDEGTGAGRGFKSSLLLVGAVLAILVAGMFLKSNGRNEARRTAAPADPPPLSLPLGTTIAPELKPADAEEAAPKTPAAVAVAAAPVAADPLVMALATRAEADCGRLAKDRGRFTAQLLVACKPETVDRLLVAAHGSTKLYVLPARVRDDACFRVCFGAYATSKEAAAAADLPKALRGKERIGAVEIAKVLP